MRRTFGPRRVPLPPYTGNRPSPPPATSLTRTSDVVRPRRSFESGSFCHTGSHCRVVCLPLVLACLSFSLSLSFSLGDLFSVSTPLLCPNPVLWSASSPFLLVSLAPSRHPHRFKRGADSFAVLSLHHVLSPYASPAHNIHFHHLSRQPARRFTVRLGGGVRRSPRHPARHTQPSLFPPPSRNECCSTDYRRLAHRRYCLVTDAWWHWFRMDARRGDATLRRTTLLLRWQNVAELIFFSLIAVIRGVILGAHESRGALRRVLWKFITRHLLNIHQGID